MLDRVLSARIRDYAPANQIEQENNGDVSRRYLPAHRLWDERFSEDLDFLLKRPEPDFRWQCYLESVRKDCEQEGIPFPPAGSMFTTSYITFPVTAPLTTQSLESGFALKLHALLCRTYVKGRDWYDFV